MAKPVWQTPWRIDARKVTGSDGWMRKIAAIAEAHPDAVAGNDQVCR